jgi:hypothetical protein
LRRIILAFVCFFRVLLGKPLPAGLRVEGLAAAPPPRELPPPAAPPRASAIALLALLQREGRLVDFLREEIADFSDERIGAAVRAVHRGCRRALEEHVGLEPVIDVPEGGPVRLEKGFDAAAIRLTGAVHGAPPFSGTLRHPGWRATRADLPGDAGDVVAPAEVEL